MSWGKTEWYCDKCNACLDYQPGFNTYGGTWRCAECGALNDVSEFKAMDFDEMLKKGTDEFTSRPLWDPDDDDY